MTVEPGVKVGDLCDQLRPMGLTLENLASIAEQQIGGFIQVRHHHDGHRPHHRRTSFSHFLLPMSCLVRMARVNPNLNPSPHPTSHPNLDSVKVGAHGTGASVPPVDMQVVRGQSIDQISR